MIRRCRHRIWVSSCCYLEIIRITRSIFNSSFISALQTVTGTHKCIELETYREHVPMETLQRRKIIREKKKSEETVIVIEQRLLAERSGIAKASL